MSGHSKWHNIQAHKGKQDKLKANAFTKIARFITVAARDGGGDPDMNFGLRLAIEKARAVNMPKDNIDRAIKKGTGEGSDGATFEEIVYEGFGPNGVAFMVEAMTDNKNRTVGEVKQIFTLHGGSMAGPGSVQWQFLHLGVVRLEKELVTILKTKNPDYELMLIDAGASDILESDFGLEIRTPIELFQKVLEAVKSVGIEPTEAGIEWVAKEPAVLDEETSNKVNALYEALDEHDDVKAVYTNAL